MTRRQLRLLVALAGVALISGSAATVAQGSGGLPGPQETFLTGYEEVPALSGPGGGSFRVKLTGSDELSYRLSYANLTTTVTQAHIHFGQLSVNGGVSVFLCTNLGNGPAGTQACPESGTVTGAITPADVIGPVGQGITAGEFDELVSAIRAGVAYVNVHTANFPAGEIRGQLGHRH